MGNVKKVYGDNNLWNLRAWVDSNPLTLAEITLVNHGPTVLELAVTIGADKFRGVATGSFVYEEPAITAAQVSGLVSTFTVQKNGQPHEYEAYASPIDFATMINAGYEQQISQLGGNDLFVGSPTGDESDEIQGLAGNDTFIGYASGQWGDKFYGGDGIDTAVYRGKITDYKIEFIDWMWDGRVEGGGRVPGYQITDRVAERDGVDYLNNVERLRFSDGNLALDIAKGENAGSVDLGVKVPRDLHLNLTHPI